MSNTTLLSGWRQRWNKSLFKFLGRRVRATVDIEDLAQETYLRLLRARDLRDVSNPQAYLLTVARHVILEWRNEHAPQVSHVPLDEDLLVDDSSPDLELEAQVPQQQLERALATVSPVMRATLLLRLRDDQSSSEIAEKLGLTDRQVKRYLARGYEHLRVILEK